MPKKQSRSFRLRIKLDIGGATIGPGKADLMRGIEVHGSISAAAREMGLNFRRASLLIDTLNKALGEPVVETTKGGASKGGASLSKAGLSLLSAYDHCVEKAEDSTTSILDTLQKELAVTKGD